MNWFWGLFHVRRLWLGLLLTGVSVAGTATWYDVGFSFRVTTSPPRGVGSPELFATVLAALLPAACLPSFDARERLSVLRARVVHSVVSAALLAGPLLVFAAWYLSVRWHAPSQRLPPADSFLGNVAAAASIGLLSCLLLGRFLGPVVTLVAYYAAVVYQQAFPSALLSTQSSTGVVWYTNWWLTAILVAGALAVDFLRHSVPFRDG